MQCVKQLNSILKKAGQKLRNVRLAITVELLNKIFSSFVTSAQQGVTTMYKQKHTHTFDWVCLVVSYTKYTQHINRQLLTHL